MFHKHVSSVLSVFFFYVVSVVSGCFKSRLDECSGSSSGRCGSDFQQCFLTSTMVSGGGQTTPCSNGQWQLEAALGRVPLGGACPAWAREMAREATTGVGVRMPRLDVRALTVPVRGRPSPRPVTVSCAGGALRSCALAELHCSDFLLRNYGVRRFG